MRLHKSFGLGFQSQESRSSVSHRSTEYFYYCQNYSDGVRCELHFCCGKVELSERKIIREYSAFSHHGLLQQEGEETFSHFLYLLNMPNYYKTEFG